MRSKARARSQVDNKFCQNSVKSEPTVNKSSIPSKAWFVDLMRLVNEGLVSDL